MDVLSTWRRLAGESRGVVRIDRSGRVEFAGKGEIEPTDAATVRAFFVAMGRELELGEPRELATASTSGAALFLYESNEETVGVIAEAMPDQLASRATTLRVKLEVPS